MLKQVPRHEDVSSNFSCTVTVSPK